MVKLLSIFIINLFLGASLVIGMLTANLVLKQNVLPTWIEWPLYITYLFVFIGTLVVIGEDMRMGWVRAFKSIKERRKK